MPARFLVHRKSSVYDWCNDPAGTLGPTDKSPLLYQVGYRVSCGEFKINGQPPVSERISQPAFRTISQTCVDSAWRHPGIFITNPPPTLSNEGCSRRARQSR